MLDFRLAPAGPSTCSPIFRPTKRPPMASALVEELIPANRSDNSAGFSFLGHAPVAVSTGQFCRRLEQSLAASYLPGLLQTAAVSTAPEPVIFPRFSSEIDGSTFVYRPGNGTCSSMPSRRRGHSPGWALGPVAVVQDFSDMETVMGPLGGPAGIRSKSRSSASGGPPNRLAAPQSLGTPDGGLGRSGRAFAGFRGRKSIIPLVLERTEGTSLPGLRRSSCTCTWGRPGPKLYLRPAPNRAACLKQSLGPARAADASWSCSPAATTSDLVERRACEGPA